MRASSPPFLGLALTSLALATIVALGSFVSGAGAAGPDPYSLKVQALLSPSGTDVTVQVGGPVLPSLLEKVQVKAWPAGAGEAETRNFFDVPSPGGVAALRLSGLERGERLEVRAHVEAGPQHNLNADATVRRRPDLALAAIDVPGDVVRTRPFDVTVTVAEVGGDVGAAARVELYDGPSVSPLASSGVIVSAATTTAVTFRSVVARPGEHTLRAVVTAAEPAEWDVAPNVREQQLYVNHYGGNGVVATDHPLATQIGVDVLEHGGNAFDAAAAVQFALNVTQPHLSGIGGGSNVLVRDGKSGELFAIDAREAAPAATTPTTYSGLTAAAIRPNGFAVGVPGTLRAVQYLLDRWGTKPLVELLGPSIKLAEEGFPIGNHLAGDLASPVNRGAFQPETREIFLNADGSPLGRGDLLKQPDLAKTFRLLTRNGLAAFYDGEIAEAIVAAQRRAQSPGREGTMTLADLHSYAIDLERPLSLSYRGYSVYGPGPSTNGGLVLLESLGLIREFRADPRNQGYEWGFATRNSLHVFIEAMRLAFADRDFWIGDDRYTNVPAAGLLDSDYLRARSTLIGRETVMCNPVAPGNPLPYGDPAATETDVESSSAGHTTHFSIIDRWGNAVVMTSTIRNSFGTGITVPGYGFLLNDSLGLFNLPTPKANPATGDPGANDAAGGKRPMGSMTPTLILKDGEPFVGTGSLGANFIPSVVLNVVLNLLEYDLPLQQAIDAPRLWMQLASGAAQVNFGLDALITPLRAMGHVAPVFGGCADNLNRTPLPPLNNLGSTGSFGVDLQSFELTGGADSTRFPDASAAVVERP
jgi:gamma-glutamyltranspeptidase / glutathione hydrolase